MGLSSEAALAKHPPLEAEMRRRLWWALVLFDTRISETSSHRLVTLDPTWDCKIPLNVNDSDLRLEMKEPPTVQGTTTDALFAVVRCKLSDFIRHHEMHVEITNPVLIQIARNSPRGGMDLAKLEAEVEDQYLKFCDPENALHYMTIWTARANLAKFHLVQHCLKQFDPSVTRTQAYRDAATSYALRMLECDTKVMGSPLTKGFAWLHHLHFPFPAYLQVTQDLRTRPLNDQSLQAWDILDENYGAWSKFLVDVESPLFKMFAKLIVSAWDTCKPAENASETTAVPKIVSAISESLGRTTTTTVYAQAVDAGQWNNNMDMNTDDFSTSVPMNFVDPSLPYEMVMQDRPVFGPDMYSGMAQQPMFGLQNSFSWGVLGRHPGWGGF